jgi:hypothetical protein
MFPLYFMYHYFIVLYYRQFSIICGIIFLYYFFKSANLRISPFRRIRLGMAGPGSHAAVCLFPALETRRFLGVFTRRKEMGGPLLSGKVKTARWRTPSVRQGKKHLI